MRLATVLRVLWSHWTYRPLQLFALLVGLSLATGLWTGVQAINTEARSSYKAASSTIVPNALDHLERSDGLPIALQTYVELQRAGWRTSPVLEGQVRAEDGRLVRVIGIDPVTMPEQMAELTTPGQPLQDDIASEPASNGLIAFLAPPHRIIISTDLAELQDERFKRAEWIESPNLPFNTLLADISFAERLLGQPGEISRLVLDPKQSRSRVQLSEIAPQLQRITNRSGADMARLTDSFHLNLSAFGMLAFAVGLFIVQGTINLAFEQRRTMCRTLRVTGTSMQVLTLALMLELLLIAVIAGGLGVVLGYFIAALLLPDVAATLRGLYGAQVSGDLDFHMGWWLAGLAIAVAGTFLAAFWSLTKLIRMPILAANRPRAWALMSSRSTWWRLIVSAGLMAIAGALLIWGTGLVSAFTIVGAFLLGSALLLPDAMVVSIRLFESLARRPVAQWFWADTRQQLPGLSLALMALLLALAANVGVSTMVGSFRLTFNGWLDQRLASELYVRAANDEQSVRLQNWLAKHPKVDAVLPIWSVDTRIGGEKGQVFGIADHATYRDHWPLLDKTASVWSDVAKGRAILVNEQFARRNRLNLGESVTIGEPATASSLSIAGIYSDYGNPHPQALIAVDLLTNLYPEVPRRRFAIRVAPQEASQLASQIGREFDLGGRALVDQASIKRRSVDVFERTFTVTQALNVLTLSVAGFAIFTSLLTQSAMRLPQLAPVWALGLTRRQLAGLELLRGILLAGLTMVLALPLGLGLAWLLLAVVNVEAFGWRLPMFVFARDWLMLGFYGLFATALAAAIPARRFSKTDPAELVKVFAHER
ncbi:MAG: FtsX-like permease family protein [Rhizobiaceae bacterium]